jgi:membrane-bound lytic murein transglycosylase
MIFWELLKKHEKPVKEAVNELFETAFNNQSHPQDLLLILIHGFYEPFYETYTKPDGSKLYPFVIGPAKIGQAERTFYELINSYRHLTHIKESLSDHDKIMRGY